MLELHKNDGTVKTFANYADLCTYLMSMENEKLLGINLYLMLEKDGVPGVMLPGHTPAVIKSENGICRLILDTRDGVRILDPGAIGIKIEALDALFEQNRVKGKVFLVWDDPMLEALKAKGGCNKFWGDNIRDPWSFLVLTPNRVAALISTLRKPYDPLLLQEAWEKQLVLVEICKGNFKELKQIIIEPDIDIEVLRKSWCADYCKAHNMQIKETV